MLLDNRWAGRNSGELETFGRGLCAVAAGMECASCRTVCVRFAALRMASGSNICASSPLRALLHCLSAQHKAPARGPVAANISTVVFDNTTVPFDVHLRAHPCRDVYKLLAKEADVTLVRQPPLPGADATSGLDSSGSSSNGPTSVLDVTDAAASGVFSASAGDAAAADGVLQGAEVYTVHLKPEPLVRQH